MTTAATASIDYASAIDFGSYVRDLAEYAQTWIPERRDAIIARVLDFQDAGVRVMLRNWSALMDEYDRETARARLELASDMGRALDEPDAGAQAEARESALRLYRDSMAIAEYTRERAAAYKQVLDDLIFQASKDPGNQ